jgi:hypothetical protein
VGHVVRQIYLLNDPEAANCLFVHLPGVVVRNREQYEALLVFGKQRLLRLRLRYRFYSYGYGYGYGYGYNVGRAHERKCGEDKADLPVPQKKNYWRMRVS